MSADKIEKREKPAGRRTPWILLLLGLLGLALVFGGLFLPKIINTIHPLGNRTWEEMGQRGDLYGGFMNPILSFLAFMGVLYSIYLQRLDLQETQRETQRQQFEATFFQLLAQHDRIVQALDIRSRQSGHISQGRDCFLSYTRNLEQDFREFMTIYNYPIDKAVTTAYNNMWQEKRQDLGHYFRFLYNFLRFVDEAELATLKGEHENPRIKYTRILRAQLSDYELAMIFFNCFNERGHKLKRYVCRYNLLDNLSPEVFGFPGVLELRAGMGKVGELPAIAETVQDSMPHGGQLPASTSP